MSGILQGLIASISSAAAAVTDTYFNLVTLLLNTSSTNGAQNNTFLDSSTNNFTITRNGNTTQGTFTPFSQTGWSNYFDGSSYLTTPNNAALNIDTTYSAEIWLYPTVSSADQVILSGNGNWDFLLNNGNVVMRWFYPGYVDTGTTALQLNTWHHIAFSISGGRLSFYVNGTRTYTNASVSITNGSAALTYLGWNGGNNKFYGYLSNARITKGSTPYDPTQTTITVPTAPLTAITNTQFLTCQSNRFIDNSTNAFALTVNGTPSVQAFSPFAPTAAYSTSAVGGSAYFDGSGDYLSVSNAAFNFSATDFTIEFWFYNAGTTGSDIMLFQWGSGASGDIQFVINQGGTTGNIALGTSGQAKTATATTRYGWNHIAGVKSGTTYYTYVNGVRNTTQSGGSPSTSTSFNIFNGVLGYISGLKISNTAVYTGTTLTVPTSPPTSDANTQLLCNFTNAGIYDSAAKNDLETVGNAQVSTTQAKWGTTSMYFDGTGDYLFVKSPSTDLCAFGTGNWTVEMWLYPITVSTTPTIFDTRPVNTNGNYINLYADSSGTYLYVNSTNVITGSALSINTWTHLAICRSGTSTKMFINGTQTGSTYSDSTNYLCGANRPSIGTNGFVPGVGDFNGYIDDLRITKGYARYTTNFSVPTSAFPTQ